MTDQSGGGGQPPGGGGGWGQQPPGSWGTPPQQPGHPQQPAQPPQQPGLPPSPQPGATPPPPPQPPQPHHGQQPQQGGEQYPPGYFAQVSQSYQPDQEEITQGFNAHLFGGLAAFIFCGMAIPVAAPLIVFATAKEKRPFMLYHVNQSLMFQGIMFAINAGIATVGGILTFVCIGYFVLMLLPITWLISVIYPLVVGMGAKRGEWVQYPFIGDKLMREWKPLIK